MSASSPSPVDNQSGDQPAFRLVARKRSFFSNPKKTLAFILTALLLTLLLMTIILACWPAIVPLVPVGVAAFISVMTGFSLASSAVLAAATVVAMVSATIVAGFSFLAAKLVDIFGKKTKIVKLEEINDSDNTLHNKNRSSADLLTKLGPSRSPRHSNDKKISTTKKSKQEENLTNHFEDSEGLSFSAAESVSISFSNSQGS